MYFTIQKHTLVSYICIIQSVMFCRKTNKHKKNPTDLANPLKLLTIGKIQTRRQCKPSGYKNCQSIFTF